MKKSWLAFVSFLLVIFSFAVVFMKNEADRPKSASRQDMLVVGIPGDVDSFNPLFNESAMAKELTHLLLVGLVDLDDKSDFLPELAQSWERSDDYLQLTYHLRKNACWSDGVPITAEDVQFTYDLLQDTVVASPNRWVTDFIKKIEVIDPYTIRFTFTEPYPDQIFDTANEIVPKHILQNVDRKDISNHDFGRHPVSSGPYILQKWVNQQFIEFVPNKHYFGNQSLLSRVIFKVIPDKTNMLLQLRTGEIDMMVGVEPDQVARLRLSNPEIQIYPISGRQYYYIGYNEVNPLFSSAVIRRALTTAIDRQGIIDATLMGFGEPCVGHIPPMIGWAYDKNIQPLPFDIKQSQELLAKAGWIDHNNNGWIDKDGREFEFVLRTNSGNQVKSDLAVLVQDQLRKVGIKVDLQTMEWTTFIEKLGEKDFDAYIGGWNTSFNVDPTPIFHSSSTDLFNYTYYNNPRVDHLIEVGRVEMDREKAAKIWYELQEQVYKDQPYTFLFWIDKIVAVHSRFKNVTPIPLSVFYGLENWYVDKNYTD